MMSSSPAASRASSRRTSTPTLTHCGTGATRRTPFLACRWTAPRRRRRRPGSSGASGTPTGTGRRRSSWKKRPRTSCAGYSSRRSSRGTRASSSCSATLWPGRSRWTSGSRTSGMPSTRATSSTTPTLVVRPRHQNPTGRALAKRGAPCHVRHSRTGRAALCEKSRRRARRRL